MSILESIKQMLGIETGLTHFDQEIIVHINSALMSLGQIGVGPDTGFIIISNAETWGDFIGESKNLEAVKLYVYYKVRIGFDPPSSSYVVDAMERQIKEIEWRLNVAVFVPEPEEPILDCEEECCRYE